MQKNPDKKISKNKVFLVIKTMFRVIKMVSERYPILAGSTLALSIFFSVSSFLISGSQALLINNIQATLTTGLVFNWLFPILTITALIVPDFMSIASNFVDKRLWMLISEMFEVLIMTKRDSLDIATHESSEFQNLMNKINEKGTWILSSTFTNSLDILKQAFIVIIAGIIIGATSWKVLILIVVCTVPYLYSNLKYGENAWGIWGIEELAVERRKFWEYESYFKKTQSIIEMRLFQASNYFLSTASALLGKFNNKQKELLTRRTVADMVSHLIFQIAFAIAFIVYLKKILAGEIGIGTFIFILASIQSFQTGLSSLFQKFGDTYENTLFATDFFKFLDMKSKIVEIKNSVVLKTSSAPEIIFENISFKYPGTETYVYKNFSLTIPAGEKLALIGVNGAGKTTLIKLLCRFYDPTDGRILIDGIDLREIKLSSWYERMGILFQDYGKYHLTVDELVGLGNTNKKPVMKHVKKALMKSDAYEFVEKWKGKYHQQIGNEFDGVEPSIGQWQKLSLGRVFYRDPQVWILDEPTSSIDAEAEAKIFEKLEQLPSNKTVILVSHRFSTVRNADIICVIQNGSVIEHGSHIQLMELNGEYARLFNIQAEGYR